MRPKRALIAPLAILAAGTLAAGTLAGCGRGDRLDQLIETPSGVTSYAIDANQLYVAGVPAAGVVTAYRLEDGKQSWRVPAIEGSIGLDSTPAVLTAYPARCADDQDLSFTLLDAEHGTTRWRHEGSLVGIAGTGYLLLVRGTPAGCTGGTDMHGAPTPAAGDSGTGDSGTGDSGTGGGGTGKAAPDRLVDLDASNGSLKWTRPLPAGGALQPVTDNVGALTDLVTLAGGSLQSVDPVTGAVQSTGKVPERAQPASAGQTLILATPAAAGGLQLSGYEPTTLAASWRVQVPLPAGSADFEHCGDLLCAHGPQSTVAVDPATGVLRWTLPGLLVRQAGRHTAVATRVPATNSTMLVDTSTGRVTSTLDQTSVAGTAPGDRLVLRRIDGGSTVFSLLELDTGQLREVGRADGRYDSCQASTQRLACQATDSAALHVWRLG
ncbi:MAG: PQQ-binding-like beta-propeller repeat protein [Micromonosporaceae bacterium]|nr:PQQ-binding-like beta-propeller repeat protein [Micromonosporaceae bacterium]